MLLVGEPQTIRDALAAIGEGESRYLSIVPATQTIAMDEHPLEGVRKNPDASLVVCARLVAEGVAHGTLSAGNTGACMVAAMQHLGLLPGVKRPPIGSPMPTETGSALLVDAGSNVDCRPSQLLQFALLGSVYAHMVMGIENPRVGLLSNGEEESKGNELVRETRGLLAAAPLHFIGSVEGNHVFEGAADVVVCDGFSGNVLLKTAEGMGNLALRHLAAELAGAENDALRGALTRLEHRVDYASYGGAPLLGVGGVSFIAHGRSTAAAIKSGLRLAAQAARTGYIPAMKSALESVHRA